jgi:DNA-binding transcriptional LysR family regulator
MFPGGASLQQMAIFPPIVGIGSLSAAAPELQISPALISCGPAALGTRQGVRLSHRTTRRIHLTDQVARCHESCLRVLAEVEETATEAGLRRAEPRGDLRVALLASFAYKHFTPLIPGFARRYPYAS